MKPPPRVQKWLGKGFEHLRRAEFREAERNFSLAGCRGGEALSRFWQDRFDGVLSKGLAALRGGEAHFKGEREAVLWMLRAASRKSENPIHRSSLVEQVRSALEEQQPDWEPVGRMVASLAQEDPPAFSCLQIASDLWPSQRREKIVEAYRLFSEGKEWDAVKLLDAISKPGEMETDRVLVARFSFYYGTLLKLARGFRGKRGEEAFKGMRPAELDRWVSALQESPPGFPEEAALIGIGLANLGFVRSRSDLLSAALERLKGVEEGGLSDDSIRYYIALLRHNKGEFEEALRVYQSLKHPHWSSIVRDNIAAVEAALKQRQLKAAAEELCDKAKRAVEGGDKQAALALYQNSFEKLPEPAIAFEILRLKKELGGDVSADIWGVCFQHEGGAEEALEELLRRASQEAPEQALALLGLVPQERRHGKYSEALVPLLYKTAEGKGPAEALATLKRIPETHRDRRYHEATAPREEGLGRHHAALASYRMWGDAPEARLGRARCLLHLGKAPEAKRELSSLKEAPLLVFVEALRIAGRIGDEELQERICKRCLSIGESPEARKVEKELHELREAKRRARHDAWVKDALDAVQAGQSACERKRWREATRHFSKVPAEFIKDEHRELWAGALTHLEELSHAEQVLRDSSTEPARLWRLDLLLKLGRRTEAEELVDRFGLASDAALKRCSGSARGLILERMGHLRESIEFYESESDLEPLARRFLELGDYQGHLLSLNRIYQRCECRKHRQRLAEAVREVDGRIPVSFKSGLAISLGEEAVLCDTNVFVNKAMAGLVDSRIPVFGRVDVVARRFDALASEGRRMVIMPSVEAELRPVCEEILEKSPIPEGQRAQITDRVEEYCRMYKPPSTWPDAGNATGELGEVQRFYLQFPTRVRQITLAKIREKPWRARRILALRQGRLKPQLDTRLLPSSSDTEFDLYDFEGGHTPEEADMRLLAAALKLHNSVLPGVARISLLSDDRDFKEFTEEIPRDLGVRVVPA